MANAGSLTTKAANPASASEDAVHEQGGAADTAPSALRQVFASLFTPSWSFGLLLFVCLFLPAYQGCNGQVVYPRQALEIEAISERGIYWSFLVTWPFFFGLAAGVGTLWIAAGREPLRARLLWWCWMVLILLHIATLSGAIATSSFSPSDRDFLTCMIGATAVLLSLAVVTCRYCGSWFHAAMWMQLALALTAALCLSFLVPMMVFANRFLMGGKLAVTCSVLLVVATVVQRIDGHRALTRRMGESPFQLSMKSLLLLMTIGGLASAWIGVYWFLDAV